MRQALSPSVLARAAGLAVLVGGLDLSPVLAQLAPPGSEDAHVSCGHAKNMARHFFMQGDNLDGDPYYAPDPVGACLMCETIADTDVLNCNLDIEVVPTSSSITGSNTFTIKALTNGLSQFTFRLANEFTVTSALANGTTPLTVTKPSTTTRIANLDRVYNAGEIFTLTIGYSGVPTTGASSGFGSITFTTQSGQPLISSLSEPYYAYTWWPCKDGDLGVAGDNSDKFTAQVAITCPSTLKAVSNGVLQGVDTLSGSRSKYRWASNYPISTYLVCFAVTNYNQYTVNYNKLAGGTMPVHMSVYPAYDTTANKNVWALVPNMITAYRSCYGEYPFVDEKYGIYQFPFSGGMEHQTYTGQGTGSGAFDEGVTAHELGHQWWGDNVTCKTWSDIWLNEGFATYSECLWLERKSGTPSLSALKSAAAARKPSAVSGTVYRTNVSDINSIFSSTYSYNKGGWVLHMLRHVLSDPNLTYPNNDALFFTALQNYRAQFQGGAATTIDFQNSVSTTAGRDLSWFFNEWVFNGGAPAYAAGWQTFSSGGQNYLRLSLRQTQTSPIFTMPVDVRITYSGGTKTVVVNSDASTDWFVIPIPAPATAVAIDPDTWILTTATATSETYRAGPAKVIQASPAPNDSLATPPASLSVSFSENVNIPNGAITLTGPSGSVPITVSYSGTTFIATITPNSPLSGGTYTLNVPATITSVNGGAALDGELGAGATPFPTGNGNAGGNATWSFIVQNQTPACYANCDGSTSSPILTASDFTCFLTAFRNGDAYANCDGSTDAPVLTASDFTCFLTQFRAGCP